MWKWRKNNVRLGDLWGHVTRWWDWHAVYESWELGEGIKLGVGDWVARVVFGAVVGEVDAELAVHDFVVVEVADC